jgi:hypothetical protein
VVEGFPNAWQHVAKNGTFSEWVGLFDEWRKEIGCRSRRDASFHFDTPTVPLKPTTQFGHFKAALNGKFRQVPTQQMRDILNMIVYQGAPSFASVEQQRHLFETAPTWDRRALTRVSRGNAPRLADVRAPILWPIPAVEAQNAGAPRLLRTSVCWERLTSTSTTDGLFHYTDFVDATANFVADAEVFRVCALSRPSHMLREEAFHMGYRRWPVATVQAVIPQLAHSEIP